MKKRTLLAFAATIITMTVEAQTESVFDRLFAHAQEFAKNWPREKVHLHLDNTSYFQGDTIWYKATVVNPVTLQPSLISKPLYVELVDQLGNVRERQIVRLDKGEGHGQISLASAFFTGYYEIRAYTKWMLAFGDDVSYYSRTVPVYRKRLSMDEPRGIAHYNMDASMKQRPQEKLKALNVRFFPEGGQLVEGVPSVVGIEAIDRDSGWVNIQGQLLTDDGRQLATIGTIHDGMGSFVYQPVPGSKPAKAVFTRGSRKYTFTLPEAEPQGYVMQATNRGEAFDITVRRSKGLEDEPMALFVFAQGVPQTYIPIDFPQSDSRHLKVMTAELPAGTIRLALVNADGETLADRFCFVYPRSQNVLKGQVDGHMFEPFRPIDTKLRLTDSEGKPLAGASISVSIRDGIDSDYLAADDNMATDLLLTSDLRGYINKPGFYFEQNSAARRKLLDNLLLIRGWRQHDLSVAFGKKDFTPRFLPEEQLTLYGQVRGFLTSKEQGNLGVTILAQEDTFNIAGSTITDSLGYFSVPLDEFYGTASSLIQTKREGKKFTRNSRVSLFRNFEPTLRELDYNEMNPKWDFLADTLAVQQEIDSIIGIGAEAYDAQMIDEVVVTAKKRRNMLRNTEAFERDILAYYDIPQILDRLRDEGKFVPDDFADLLYHLNPTKINRDATTYGVAEIKYSVDGKIIGQEFINRGTMEMMETAVFYNDIMGRHSKVFNKDTYRISEKDADDFFTNSRTEEQDSTDYTLLDEKFVRCDLTMKPRWMAIKSYRPTHGIRNTYIQGYSLPADFYAPEYPEGPVANSEDRRRTLFWAPALLTDENGEVNIRCYNSFNTTYVTVTAETLTDGKPAATVFGSF